MIVYGQLIGHSPKERMVLSYDERIESLFYYIVNNQELLVKDRAEILLDGSVRVENVPCDAT